MSSLRTLPSFKERSDAAIERYKLASPEWRERVAPCQQLKILQWFSLIRSSGRKDMGIFTKKLPNHEAKASGRGA
jgi:hypothetical protein